MSDIAAKEQSDIRRLGDIHELSVPTVALTFRTLAPEGSVMALADVLHASDIALIVVDSTSGPTPTIREHILVARQARVPMLSVLLVDVERLYAKAPDQAAGLLALEVGEIRELLSTYELKGDSVLVSYDAETPGLEDPGAAHGLRETLRTLSRFVPVRVQPAEMGSANEIWGAIYLLTEAETGGHAESLMPDDSVMVWSEGTRSRAKLASISPYFPGDFREMPLTLDAPLKAREGSRILLLRDGRIVGLGAVTQLGR